MLSLSFLNPFNSCDPVQLMQGGPFPFLVAAESLNVENLYDIEYLNTLLTCKPSFLSLGGERQSTINIENPC